VYIPKSGATGSLTDSEYTEINYDARVNQAFNKLFLLMKNELFQHSTVGNDEVKYSTKKHLQRWLEDEFINAYYSKQNWKASCIS